MIQDKGKRCYAIGVVPTQPFLLWDYDINTRIIIDSETKESETKPHALVRLQWLANAIQGQPTERAHWCIRETKNGYHLIVQVETWDIAQDGLEWLYKETGKQSIMSCRKQRVRISPKWDVSTGKELSPAPRVICGCEHSTEYWNDIKTGRLEFYSTYERGLDTGLSETDWQALGERNGKGTDTRA